MQAALGLSCRRLLHFLLGAAPYAEHMPPLAIKPVYAACAWPLTSQVKS